MILKIRLKRFEKDSPKAQVMDVYGFSVANIIFPQARSNISFFIRLRAGGVKEAIGSQG
jgi:hypothetical protein